MSEPINLTQLRKLHAAPKNAIGNMRYMSQAQAEEYFATHDALLALIDAAEAAWQELPAEDDFAHCAHPNTRAALARFDFGDA